MGRGKSSRNVELIDAAYEILREIHPASVRAVCYQLFTRRLIASMGKNDTNRVSTQLREAREQDLIPWSWIVDETREAEYVSAWENPAAYVEMVKHAYRRDRWTDQPERIEVWSEKGTVRGTLAPVLDEYGVTFRVMHGYGSATVVHDVAEESQQCAKPWTALYVGDWDPSGLHMSDIDLPNRLECYGGEITVERIALTSPQLHGLPWFATADKQGDTRYAWYRRHFGAKCWELDALSPVVLRQVVKDAIADRLDRAAWDRAEVTEAAERESLRSILDTWPGISRPASE